jgi:response regulator RpfG family c-di-GMP phosphodiesterase
MKSGDPMTISSTERGVVTVLIAERHRAVAQSLARVIGDLGSARVTGSAPTATDALELIVKLAPDIAIVDLELSPDCSLVTGMHAAVPDTRIIVMGDRMRDERAALVKALESGAVGAIYKQASIEELARAVERSSPSTPVVSEEAAGLLLGSYLEKMVEKRQRDLSTIEALAAALEVRDLTTGQHVQRVTELATACLQQIDPDLNANEEVSFGFMLHDVGKIGVPDAVLNKPGPLSQPEWELMKQHPEMGVRIVEPLGFSDAATEIILHHHERWDGTGYPLKLSKEEIPLAARAFAVVDAFDAMTNDRPYRPAMDRAEVHGVLRDASGTFFDPDVVDVVVDLT